MPCYTRVKPQTAAEALKRLEAKLASGDVQVVIGPQGALAFKGWTDNDGVSDLCAYRKLMSDNSPEFRRALMKAQIMAGRDIDLTQISEGQHSHDGDAPGASTRQATSDACEGCGRRWGRTSPVNRSTDRRTTWQPNSPPACAAV